MPAATMTSKGQVTIPKLVRGALGLETGDQLDFELATDGSVRLQARKGDARSFAGLLRRPGIRRLAVEQMDAAIARQLAGEAGG
jgi:AbrB family looped-hinge helix DNA binding protein